jgi:ligand-binding sensor domain-containing protein/signal transduction histidine kinase
MKANLLGGIAGSSMRLTWWKVIGAVWIWGSMAHAVAPNRALSQPQSEYTRSVWRVSDGLPEDTVQAIVESRDGVLWIGTTGGLTRFDGTRMDVPASVQPLLAKSIFTLSSSRDGSLWAGTEGGGLLRLKSGKFRVYSTGEGVTDGFVRKVIQDSRGSLWVGTDDGLFRLKNPNVESVPFERVDQGTVAPIAVHSITEDHTGRMWVGGSRLIALDPNGTEHEFSLPGAYSQNRVKTLLETRDGRLWIGTVGGLQYFENGQFHTVASIRATVRTLLEASDGTLWIGTIGNGAWTLRGDKLTHVSEQGLLPSETVLYLFEDTRRQIWIGTQAGLVRLNKTPVRVIPLPEGGDPDFETISGDAKGNIWTVAQSLYLIHNDVARRVTYGGLNNIKVRNVFRAQDGALWIGTDGSGAYRIEGDQIRHYTAPSELTNNFIRGFLESRDGSIWIATDEGVSRISAGESTKFTEANGLVFYSIRSLLQDRDGVLWIGTDHGLSRWNNGRFEQDAATATLAQDKVWSILQDRQGSLWFGTRDHGLFRYRSAIANEKEVLQQFTSAQGLPSNSIYQVLQDRTGRFWLTGPSTIASVAESEMERDPSTGQPLSVQTYSIPFGADGAQMYGGRQPAGYLAPDDSVWFPTSRGAAHLTNVIFTSEPAPRASVDQVLEDGQSLTPDGALHVASNIVRLSFEFTALSLRPQQGVRFRYKLDGFDSTWNLGSVSHTATYTNLRAGHYTFRVQAFNTSNPSSVSEFDLPLVKAHVFYETSWFYLLCSLLLAAIVWGLYQMRVRVLRQRFAAVLAERNRLAREMHDTVIQGCTGISALLEAMASTQGADPLDKHAATKEGLLEYARVQARTTIEEAREAIWNMRHERENDVDLIAALAVVAKQTNRESEAGESRTLVTFDHKVDRLLVSASVAHEILMTVREAVYNAVQHSSSPKVEVALSVKGDNLLIRVADQGCGFVLAGDTPSVDGHYGIVGMRERVLRLGGHVQITSTPGSGTQVQLRLKVEGGAKCQFPTSM